MFILKYFKKIVYIYLPIIFSRPYIIPKIFYGFFKTLILKKPVLKSVEFSITSRCNSKCVMCFSDKYLQKDKNELSIEEIKVLWKKAKKLGAVGAYLIGGEPTVRKDFLDILRALEPKKYIIGMVSNSLSLTEELIKQMKKVGLSWLTLSIDGFQAEENDKIRGIKGHFNKVIQVVEWCKKYNIKTEMGMVLSHKTIKYFDKMINFSREKGFTTLAPSVMVPVGKWVDNKDDILTDNDWQIIYKKTKENDDIRFDTLQNYSMRFECTGGIEKICISPYGDILTCSVNPISFGNTRDLELKEIWEKIHKFRFFAKGRHYPRCPVASDYEYHTRYIEPMSNSKINPVPVDENKLYKEDLIDDNK